MPMKWRSSRVTELAVYGKSYSSFSVVFIRVAVGSYLLACLCGKDIFFKRSDGSSSEDP